MSASIYRLVYETIPGVSGWDTAELVSEHFQQSENGTYYITEEAATEALDSRNLTAENKNDLKALLKAVKKHGPFDLSIPEM